MRPAIPDAILVGDADGALAGAVGEALERSGYVVVGARTPLEVLAAARLSRPLVAAIDAGMPGARALSRQLAGDVAAGPPLVVQVGPQRVPALVGDAGDRVIRLDDAGGSATLLPWDAQLADRLDGLARRVREGRSASPLTGLPGNAAIRAELERRLHLRRPFGLLHADIDGFKAYNDHYGFLRGDQVLRAVGDLLRAIALDHPDAFVGHVGGDDFTVLTGDPIGFAEQVLTAFHDVAPEFYDECDARRGWISGKDRRGRRVRWPLLTVSIGVACSSPDEQRDALALVDVATEMKSVAKRSPGSAIAVDRRSSSAGIHRSPKPPPSPAQLARYAAGGLAACAVGLALIVPSGVAAARWAQPDDRLWAAKVLIEDARLLLAGEPQARAEVHLSIAADRLAAALVPSDHEAALLDDVHAQLQAARALSDELPAGAAAGVRAAVERQAALLDVLAAPGVRPVDGAPRVRPDDGPPRVRAVDG